MTGDTIVALSSGRLPAAVAVLRISGPEAFAAATLIAGPLPPPRELALRALRRPCDAMLLDRALVVAFPGPTSATSEDVVELHAHGGVAVVEALLDTLTAMPGVRLAEPGEFTRRAFEAGRLDLTQVEGLADLLAASTETQRAQALAQAEGALGGAAAGWREKLTLIRAEVEASLDFADLDEVDQVVATWPDLAVLTAHIEHALAEASRGEQVRGGFRVALVGAPNVGKSTLFNALIGREAAIVATTPGTTRDTIEATLDLDGMAVTLTDTAGLRESDDPIEIEGMARARRHAAQADLVLHLCEMVPSETLGVPLFTKRDVQHGAVPPDALVVSAHDAASVATLRRWLSDVVGREGKSSEPALVTRGRQRDALTQCLGDLRRAMATDQALLAAEALRSADMQLTRLLGRLDTDHLLGVIFSRFCIGK